MHMGIRINEIKPTNFEEQPMPNTMATLPENMENRAMETQHKIVVSMAKAQLHPGSHRQVLRTTW
jgi:hypothetical protein